LATADLEASELEAFIAKFQGPKTFGAHLACRTPSLQILGAMKRFARQVSVTPHNPLKETGGRVLYYAAIAAALVRCNSRISSLGNHELLAGFEWARVQAGTESLSDLFGIAISTLRLLPQAN